MLKILLCDDDPFFLSVENDMIIEMIEKERMDAEVAGMAHSAAEAFTFIKNNPCRYLVFLDLDFGRGLPNGLDISAILKQRETGIRVVFITNHYEMAMEVLKSGAEPFGFLEKGSDRKLLASGFRRYICMALRSEHDAVGEGMIRLPVGFNETVEIRVSDVLYLEAEKSVSHGITYHTVNGSQITILGTLDAEAKRLGDGFLRVHRSCLVAKKQILDLHNSYLILSDQQEIPCAFRMKAEVKKWLQKK